MYSQFACFGVCATSLVSCLSAFKLNGRMSSSQKYFLTLDLGTTSTRAHVIDMNFAIVSGARFESQLIQDHDGMAELDPEDYFRSIVGILREAVRLANIDAKEIISIGVSCQRATFITWDKVTGEPFHNLITWKDERAVEVAEKINKSLLMKFVNYGSRFMYTITRQEFFKITGTLKVGRTWLNQRLQYFIKNNEQLKKAVNENRAAYGALDTWLLNRLKNDGKFHHVSDITSSAATGIFDAFQQDFSILMLAYFNIKRSMLPKLVSNDYDFGYTSDEIFGMPLKIATLVTDQSASMIANGCFKVGSSKITLGTGSFLQINVGRKCLGTSSGAHPLIAWCIKNSYQLKATSVFKLEFFHETSVDSIKFARTIGLCSNVDELSEIAYSVDHADGVFFIPGIRAFVGIKQTTTKSHLTRALLENIVFTIGHFYHSIKDEPFYNPKKIRIDGGIAQNDFICQQIANLTGIEIERSHSCGELTSIGCAILSARNCGLLRSLEDAESFYRSERTFVPEKSSYEKLYKNYQRYVKIMKKYW